MHKKIKPTEIKATLSIFSPETTFSHERKLIVSAAKPPRQKKESPHFIVTAKNRLASYATLNQFIEPLNFRFAFSLACSSVSHVRDTFQAKSFAAIFTDCNRINSRMVKAFH